MALSLTSTCTHEIGTPFCRCSKRILHGSSSANSSILCLASSAVVAANGKNSFFASKRYGNELNYIHNRKNAQNITNRNLTHILDISYIHRTRSIYISDMQHLYIGHAVSIYPIPPIYRSLVRITYTLFSHNMEMQFVIVATVTIYSSYQSRNRTCLKQQAMS